MLASGVDHKASGRIASIDRLATLIGTNVGVLQNHFPTSVLTAYFPAQVMIDALVSGFHWAGNHYKPD